MEQQLSATPTTQAVTPADKPAASQIPPMVEYTTVMDVCQAVYTHYGRRFNVALEHPSQIVDGSVFELVDRDMNITVATLRGRLRNAMIVSEDKQVFIPMVFTDLAFPATRRR